MCKNASYTDRPRTEGPRLFKLPQLQSLTSCYAALKQRRVFATFRYETELLTETRRRETSTSVRMCYCRLWLHKAVPTGFLIFSGFIGLGTLAGQVVHASVCIVLSTTLFCEAGLGRTFYPVMRVRSCYVPEPGRHCPSQQELDFAATFCGLPFCNAEEVFWSSDV